MPRLALAEVLLERTGPSLSPAGRTGSPPLTALPGHVCLLCFQLTLTIVRQTGGLGISIAGGKGSTPYKGDDEVSSRTHRRPILSPCACLVSPSTSAVFR